MKILVCSIARVLSTFANAQGLQSPDDSSHVKVAPGTPVILPSGPGLLCRSI